LTHAAAQTWARQSEIGHEWQSGGREAHECNETKDVNTSCLTKRQFFIITALVHSRPSIQVNIKTNIVFYFKGTVLFTLLYLIYLR
jgi:hypothetical protein